jgi:putative peptidoglycan lipid II flippase
MLIKIDTDLKKVISLSLAIFLGVCLANMNLVIDQVMASMVGEGAISQIGYANRFHNLIVQIVVMSVSAVLLTQLASLVVEKKDEEIKRLFQSLTNLIIFIGIFISISIYFFGKPFISILLERGALQQSDVVNISSLWFFYGLGLIPMMWGIAIAKFFQAISTPSLITKLALLSFVLNVLLNLIFTKYFGIVGLAMSTSLTYLLVALLYHANFVQKTQFSVSGRFEKVTALILTIFLYVCDNYIQIEPVSYQFCILVLIFVPITAMLLNVKSELSYIRDKYD